MKIYNNLNENEFLTLLNYSESVLKLNYRDIKQKFPQSLIPANLNKNSYEPIEIRFENERATLSCELGKAEVCFESYLFLDKLEGIEGYISFLSERYKHDFIEDKWRLPTCYVTIERMKDIFYFKFS